MASTGVPIRLVRNDGELIPLMAENITFTVDRSVPTMSMPMSGNTRMGMDLNLTKAMIVISGILTDDESNLIQTGSYSKATIDFSYTQKDGLIWYQSALASDTTFSRELGLHTDEGNKNFVFRIDASIGIGTAVSSTGTGNTVVLVPIGGAGSAADITAKLVTAITQTSHPTGYSAGTRPGDYFTAAQLNSLRTTSSEGTNAVLEITHKIIGPTKSTTPNWGGGYAAGNENYWKHPYVTTFAGGSENAGKSAGDKAMDLYGTLNNMNNGGAIGGSLTWLAGLFGVDDEEGWGGPQAALDNKYGDYIIGIQIPYDSKIQADTGSVQRNFYMPTGGSHNRHSKGSQANDNDVSVDFNPYWKSGDYTGIKGTVKQFQMSYDAGETVYNYQISFLPVDWIL